VRLFFALWPPAQAARGLHAWAQKAARETGGRVTRADTVHLTLAFLGEVDEQRLPVVIGAGRAAGGAAHRLPIEQARWWAHNRIVWVGPNETPEPLALLEVDLRRNLLERGFELETRAFAAHVTLIRKAREPRELPPLPAVEWSVSELVLVRSVLSREGSCYEVIGRFALGQK
jgi:RNA 2',3'-cyclic 3'-phosphodiesterase